ncbi:hypothetical protein MRX96_005507 [Rhipicephalus microplus]
MKTPCSDNVENKNYEPPKATLGRFVEQGRCGERSLGARDASAHGGSWPAINASNPGGDDFDRSRAVPDRRCPVLSALALLPGMVSRITVPRTTTARRRRWVVTGPR